MFEQIVAACHEELKGEGTRIMFSTGPDNLVESVVRNFPGEGEMVGDGGDEAVRGAGK